MSKFMTIAFVVLAAVVVVTSLLLVNAPRKSDRSNPATPSTSGSPDGPVTALTPNPFPAYFLSDFHLVTQDNEPFDLNSMTKQITIVGFVFSSCTLACPAMTYQMSQLQSDLSDTKVRFVCFSLDPANDTPAQLKQWGIKLNADFKRWTFLTEPRPFPNGKPQLIARSLLLNDLKSEVHDDPKNKTTAPDGTEMDNIFHSRNLFLLGPKGELLGGYNSAHPDEISALRLHAREAAKLYHSGK